MRYYFRIYYLIPKKEVMAKFKERFNCIVSVNGESHIYTNDVGKELILESERRKYIKVREFKEIKP
jgi:hypothetical protein